MTDSKSLGTICHAALWAFDRSAGDPDTPDAWEAAAQAVRKAVIEECIQAISGPLTIAASPDVIFAVQDLNELHIEALRSLKGETDD